VTDADESAATRKPWLAGLAVAVVAAALSLLNVLSAAYATYASAHLDQPRAAGTLTAAQLSAALAPWSAGRQAQLGWVLAERGDAATLQAYGSALRWAPADALLWNEAALALGRVHQFGPAFTTAVTRANALAPTSPAVQASNAALALSYWNSGSPAVRHEWLQSLRFELDNNRSGFQRQLITLGYWAPFCAYAANELGEKAWCDDFRGQRARCIDQPESLPDPSICDYAG